MFMSMPNLKTFPSSFLSPAEDEDENSRRHHHELCSCRFRVVLVLPLIIFLFLERSGTGVRRRVLAVSDHTQEKMQEEKDGCFFAFGLSLVVIDVSFWIPCLLKGGGGRQGKREGREISFEPF